MNATPAASHSSRQAKRSSRITSYCEGMLAPVPGFGRRSRSDKAKALPALQARMALHLLKPCTLHSILHQEGRSLCFRFCEASEEMGRLY